MRGTLLKVTVAVPTFDPVPTEAAKEAEMVEARTRTSVTWPDNWHQLPRRWKAVLVRELVLKLVRSVATEENPQFRREVEIALGWRKP